MECIKFLKVVISGLTDDYGCQGRDGERCKLCICAANLLFV